MLNISSMTKGQNVVDEIQETTKGGKDHLGRNGDGQPGQHQEWSCSDNGADEAAQRPRL